MDNAATSGEEIGTAMSRSASLADAAGVSFEMLGAYIATVSERTRQDAGTIGTALNAIMSRLTSVKQKGFNEEDETKVNDVAKALASVNVQLTDGQGEWRRIEDIFMDVAKVWDTLDDKTRNYLATVMAGTRQQNVFRTLMADLSNVATGTSRAMELYEGAMNSAGTAAEKYAVYQESVTAAHDRMTASLEKLFSLFDSGVMKTLYNAGGSLAEGLYGLITGDKGDERRYDDAIAKISNSVTTIASLRTRYMELSAELEKTEEGSERYKEIQVEMEKIVGTLSSQYVSFNDYISKTGTAYDSTSKNVDAINKLYKEQLGLQTQIQNVDSRRILQESISGLKAVEDEFKKAQSANGMRDIFMQAARFAYPSEKNMSYGLLNQGIALGSQAAMQAPENIFRLLQEVYAEVIANAGRPENLRASDHPELFNFLYDYLVDEAGNFKEDAVQIFEDLWDDIQENGFLGAFSGLSEDKTFGFADRIEDARKSVLDNVVSRQTYSSQYNELSTDLQREFGNAISMALQSGISESDWSLPEEELEAKLTSVAKTAADRFYANQDALQGVYDELASPDGETGDSQEDKVERLKTAYSELYQVITGQEMPDNAWVSVLGSITAKTGNQIDQAKDSVEDYSKAVKKLRQEALTAYNTAQGKSVLQNGGQDQIGDMLRHNFGLDDIRLYALHNYNGNIDVTNRQRISGQRMREAGWRGFSDDDYATFNSNTYSGRGADGREYVINLTPITPDGRKILSPQELDDYAADLIAQANGDFSGEDAARGGKGLLISYRVVPEGMTLEEVIAEETEAMERLHNISESLMSPEAFASSGVSGFDTDSFFEFLAELDEMGIKDNVLNQYDGLMAAVGAYELDPTKENLYAIIEALYNGANAWDTYKKARDEANSKVATDQQGAEALSLLSQARNAEELASIFNRELTPAQQEYVVKNSKAYQDLTDEAIDYSTAIKRMRTEAQMINADGLADQGKIWAKTADYLEDARKGGDEYYKTLSSLIGEVDDFTTAQAALNAIQSGQLEPSTDAYTDAMKTLASYTGLTAEYLQDHLGIAAEMLSDDMNLAGDSVGYLIDSMFSAANIQFDASNWRAQLMNLANDADFADQRLAQLVMSLLNLDGSTLSVGNDGHVQVNWGQRTYQRSGRSRSSSGSGSRSGSSSRSSSSSPRSSSTNEVTAIQRLVDMMDQVQNLFSYHQSMIQQIQNIYSEKGEFTNLIAVYQEEKDAIAENNKVLEENVRRLEELIPSQQALVAGMSTSDENYKQESEDLKRLQEAHQKYKKELLANVAAQDKLTKAMKDAEKQIRQLEMNLENEILQAIEDRNAREERMLQGRIEMENTILDLIKKRYEKERDEIINSANVQINALTEESRLLDEQFNKRKKLADQQDKQAKLQQLEAKLARISADPTRAKEAQTIRQQIADLRDEMAWDTAEAEVQAQQDSIDQQKQSLEDYIDYVEDYYEDLFEHPQKLIEEMKEIISQTDDEILAWLQANDETYANSTEATQTQMVKDWQTTLNDMRGVVETYWDEVEKIIGGGDEAILKFLTENHEGYLTSSEKRQQQYLDDWKELLDEIETAYQRTYDKIQSYDYDTIPIPDASSYSVGGSNYSGGGGYTGGGNPSPSQPSTPAKKTYSGILAYYGPGGLKSKNFSVQATSKDEAHKLFMAEGNRLGSYYQAGSAYAKGGLAYSTGPAWLDGKPNAPERVLSPYQTELFEDLIQTLHEVRVSANSFGFAPPTMSPNNNSFVFDGDIIVNVETLSDDADYEEVAARVGEVLVRQMSRSGAVGGIATL